jgi:hypothetical protein
VPGTRSDRARYRICQVVPGTRSCQVPDLVYAQLAFNLVPTVPLSLGTGCGGTGLLVQPWGVYSCDPMKGLINATPVWRREGALVLQEELEGLSTETFTNTTKQVKLPLQNLLLLEKI